MDKKGKLFLIPAPLGDSNVNEVIPDKVLQLINTLDEFIVENERTARRFLIKAGYSLPIENIIFHILNKHTPDIELSSFLKCTLQGKDIGLLSESGTPCLADPGADIVELAHTMNLEVVPLTGPSSVLLALIASGFNGQNFAFRGYLPIDKPALFASVKQMELKIIKENQTQIFIETPYRNNRLLGYLLQSCNNELKLCIATDITLKTEKIQTKKIRDWKTQIPEIHKRNTVFLLYK